MQDLFNPMLGREEVETLKLDRVHRITRYQPKVDDDPRDVIVRFHYYEEKAKIMENIRKMAGISYEGTELQVFSDLIGRNVGKKTTL